jgi:photosystem II stability/assembly factor-like uncharacterized protein
MFSTTTGWARTSEGLFRTTDGETWRAVVLPGVRATLAAAFASGRNAWAFGLVDHHRLPDVFVTDDGGGHWRHGPLPVPRTDAGVALRFLLSAVGPRRAWAGFDEPGFVTGDGARTWKPLSPRVAPELGFTFVTSRLGFGPASSPDQMYRTGDGGRTWKPVALPLPGSVHGNITRVSLPRFIDAHTGVTEVSVYDAVEADVLEGSVVFFVTSDAGRTWRATTPLSTHGFVEFGPGDPVPAAIVSRDRWVVASPPGLAATDDGGESWADVQAQVDLSGVDALAFADPLHGWAALGGPGCEGATGLLCSGMLRTEDGGVSWRQVTFEGAG